MNPNKDEPIDMDATEDQLAELRRLGIAEKDLEGLTACDAEDWIDELRMMRLDSDKFGRV